MEVAASRYLRIRRPCCDRTPQCSFNAETEVTQPLTRWTMQHTILPLAVAPLGAVAVFAAVEGRSGFSPGYWTALAVIYLICLAAGMIGVLPIVAFVPGLRRPPLWVAIAWGAAIAVCATAILGYSHRLERNVYLLMSAAGAAAGIVYASIAARRS